MHNNDRLTDVPMAIAVALEHYEKGGLESLIDYCARWRGCVTNGLSSHQFKWFHFDEAWIYFRLGHEKAQPGDLIRLMHDIHASFDQLRLIGRYSLLKDTSICFDTEAVTGLTDCSYLLSPIYYHIAFMLIDVAALAHYGEDFFTNHTPITRL